MRNIYTVTVTPPVLESRPVRSFYGELDSLTQEWKNETQYCVYAGNGQGGPLNPAGLTRGSYGSVIDGEYYQYKVNSSFATEFVYSRFDEGRCI